MATSDCVQKAFSLFDEESDEEIKDDIQKVTSDVVHLYFSPPDPKQTLSADDVVPPTYRPTLWAHLPPDYMGPMDFRDNETEFGGGRGYYAACDIPAGTLLLRERAYIQWPNVNDRDTLLVSTVDQILQCSDADEIGSNMALLYPILIEDLPPSMIEAARDEYTAPLTAVLARHGHTDKSTFERWLQVVVGMQCNAFKSGVFLHTALFNHDCNPNCVKFTPLSATDVSEVRAARAIQRGEQLMISYLHPREQSQERRRQQLTKQFGFTCQCTLCKSGDAKEQNGGTPLPLVSSNTASLEDVETTIGTLEDTFAEHKAANASMVLHAALEALSDALDVVPHNHILLIRIHKLVADTCDSLLHRKSPVAIQDVALLFLRSCVELLDLQRTYLDKDHIDLARTFNDISQGIRLLLSYNPDALLAEFPEWQSFRQASLVESKYTNEYKRIKKLYE
jgi:hypothetical protein